MKRFFISSAMSVALSAALMAQSPAAPIAPADPDQRFVFDTYMNGLSEIQLGELAQQKASSTEVKQFGQRLMTDHSKANDELKTIAAARTLTLPTMMDVKHKATYDRLAQLAGASFDRAFMQDMVTAHHAAVDNFRNESKNGKDADIRNWASKTLPTLEGHLSQARSVNTAVGTSGSAAPVPAPDRTPLDQRPVR
jgi:putative membrane protein